MRAIRQGSLSSLAAMCVPEAMSRIRDLCDIPACDLSECCSQKLEEALHDLGVNSNCPKPEFELPVGMCVPSDHCGDAVPGNSHRHRLPH
jgi:hypothetical protein